MRTTIDHKYEYSQEEINELAHKISDEIKERTQLESEKKNSNSYLSSQIKEKEKNISEISLKIQLGYEMREIECKVEDDEENNIRYFYNAETNELIKQCPIPVGEQRSMFDEDDESSDQEEEAEEVVYQLLPSNEIEYNEEEEIEY